MSDVIHHVPKDSYDREYHMAPNQRYTKEYLKELRDKYNIIYDGHGVFAFKIIPRKHSNPLIQLFMEDDGTLASTDVRFDIFWAKSLISNLQETLEYVQKKGKLS